MSKLPQRVAMLCASLLLLTASEARAQWLDQSISLQEGWNAVFLEIDPAPAEADALFAVRPIREVWTRANGSELEGPPECANPDDPECTPGVTSDWEIWLPPDDPARPVTNLRLIRGGRVYLIKSAAPTVLALTGMPNSAKAQWRSGFTLGGMHVESDPDATPTFAEYFAGSQALAAPTVYKVASDGTPTPIADPAAAPIEPNTGYWVQSPADTTYDGPIDIDRASLRGLDFGRRIVKHALTLENRTDVPQSIEVTYTNSATVPTNPADLPTNAGDTPLMWLEYVTGPVESAFQWHDLGTASWSLTDAGTTGFQRTIDLAIERTGLPGATLDAAGHGSQYQGLLRLRNGAGFRRWLPVVAQIPDPLAGTTAGGATARPGLYFGQVTVDHVQWITAGARTWTNADPNDPTFEEGGRCVGGDAEGSPCDADAKCPDGTCEGYCIGGGNGDAVCTTAAHCPDGRCSMETDTAMLRPTPAEFTFPIIIHLAEDGTYKLLKEVTLLWQPPDDMAQTPGRFVLATPACDPMICDALFAASIQDGEPFARRLGSAAYSFDGDLPLTGGFDLALDGEFTVPAAHPLNPFRHKYHPDHDCDQDGECFDVTRSFTFSFSAMPPTGEPQPGWGDQILGGDYGETLTGLHKNSVSVAGRFELVRVSEIPVLNVQ